MQGLGTLVLDKKERREAWTAWQLLSCLLEPKTLGPSLPPALREDFKDWPVCGDGGALGWAGESQRGKGPSG